MNNWVREIYMYMLSREAYTPMGGGRNEFLGRISLNTLLGEYRRGYNSKGNIL